jgi:hypothetical protein
MIRIKVFLFVLFFCVSGLAKEYKYEPAREEITGTVIQKMFYGPPGYGEDPNHDIKIYPYLLKTDTPNDFIADRNDPTASTEKNITEIQIILENEKIELKKFLNKKVKIKGTFSHALSAGHHTRVLSNALEIVVNK